MRVIYIITIIIFSSCENRENHLSHHVIKEFKDTILLIGDKTPICDHEVALSITICDSLLLLPISIDSPSPYIYRAYSLNTFTKIGDFLLKGRGPNEFNIFTLSLQSQSVIRENGDTKIWINNFPNKIVLLNLSKTISTGKTVIDKEYNFSRYGKRNILFESNATYMLDNGLFLMNKDIKRSKNPDNNNPENMYVIYDYNNDKVVDTLKYKYCIDNKSYLDNISSKIAKISYYDDLISIYDISSKIEKILFHSFKNPDEVAGVEKPYIPRPDYIYIDCFIKNNLIFALYRKGKTSDYEEDKSNCYLHVFDLDGKPLYNIILKDPIINISLDERTYILYGIDIQGQLYSYKLKDILSKN